MTNVPNYIFLPVIHIMDLAPVGSNNSTNRGCSSLVLIPLHNYLLDSNLCNTIMNSVDYFTKIIIWDMTHVIPVVCILVSHMHWVVCCGCSLYIRLRAANVHVWNYADTGIFILGLMCIHKNRGSCCNHRFVFSCEPNYTRFPLLVACLRDPLINGAFPVIALLQITPFRTRQIWPLFVGEEYIWIANVHTINEFLIATSSSAAPATTTVISSTTASKVPSTTSVSAASYSVHHVYTAPADAPAHLGGGTVCLSV